MDEFKRCPGYEKHNTSKHPKMKVGKFDLSLSAAVTGNIVTSQVTNRTTNLEVTLGILLREKYFIKQMSHSNVCCKYDEVIRFIASALIMG